ncbi:MAG: tripartite tricarboxylate transporter TctB family protein [Spirochaetales bacterium]|nr:tripartite tricarboxylate transporter TctB family protein [Spirochaetales bacterium]
MKSSIVPSLLFLLLGLIYTTATLLLPEASVGRPFEPKIFPLTLGIAMILLSLGLMARELKTEEGESSSENVPFYKEAGFSKILLTCLFSLVYALVFDKLGYVLSTMLFLEAELLIFNGKENWKINTIVSLAFSLFIYIVFSKLLGVYLPMTPVIWI